MKIGTWIEQKEKKKVSLDWEDDDCRQNDGGEKASLGFSKTSIFVSMPLAELNCTSQPLWNSLSLTAVHRCTRLLVLIDAWQGLCPHCRTGAFQDPMGEPCSDVLTLCWEDNAACCLPLSSLLAEDLAAWAAVYDFRDSNLDRWATTATRHIGECICLDMHHQIPLMWCSYDTCRNCRLWSEHNMPVEMPFWNQQ